MVPTAQPAAKVAFLGVGSGDIIELQRALSHVLDVVYDVPEDAFGARRRGEAAAVQPAPPHVDPRKQLLQVNSSLPAVQVHLFDNGELVLDDLGQEALEVVHVFALSLRQTAVPVPEDLLRLWHIKEERRDNVAPVVKHVLLILLHVHKLVHNVELEVELASVNSMFGRAVEVELNAAYSKVFQDLLHFTLQL